MTMSANEALRLAQRLILGRADSLPQVEVGYQNFSADPRTRGLREAARMIDDLIQPEEVVQSRSSDSTLLSEIETEISRAHAAAEATGDMDSRLYAVALRGWAMRIKAQEGRP